MVVVPCQYFPVYRHSSNLFCHLIRPTYLLLPSCISSAAVSIPVVLHLRHLAHPSLSSPLILSAIPIILERQNFLTLVVVPCQYLPSPFPSLQPISPYPLSHISSVAVPQIICRRIHLCCLASLPLCLSTAIFTTDLVFHPYFLSLYCGPYHKKIPFFRVLCRRCLSTFPVQIFSLLYVVLYYTSCSALLHTTFITFGSDVLTKLLFSLLARLFSLSL